MEVEEEQTTIIYPSSISKYRGNITKTAPRKNGMVAYQAHIAYNEHKINKNYYVYQDAFDLIKDYNIVNNLPIRNMIHEKSDHLVVFLTQDQKCIVDKESMEIIQAHVWYAAYADLNDTYYAVTSINRQTVRLHNMVMNHIPSEFTIDHMDRDSLNNCKGNLRPVTQREQVLNQRLRINNTSKVKGVSKTKDGRWIAKWTDTNGNQRKRSFSLKKHGDEAAKQLAIQERLLHGSID